MLAQSTLDKEKSAIPNLSSICGKILLLLRPTVIDSGELRHFLLPYLELGCRSPKWDKLKPGSYSRCGYYRPLNQSLPYRFNLE